ncbi:bifunctional 2-polyprenyl-6-hydroxyphenol methylase/3-demethylubiquinol 3-O-methyltransferase UbiG [Methylococcus sp. EFPC2]|uniref:class I SAM-dependent methyltransferase n=1 Tax=Methylococcus sp. EFPC2 TaxID=2812648 RepID=UPI0019683EDB|nr:class I SAM-dependent methyltransferase [Methylococcus sp. EFPC2]QSA96508.1 class I SAM-dependent methyltransferase [Methylococcus sp. EFPC2]
MDERSRLDWMDFSPEAIPTKTDLSRLEAWLDTRGVAGPARILDLGCGAGALSRRLVQRGYSVTGMDINAKAIAEASAAVPAARFETTDIASPLGLGLIEPAFDGVVCQLVISIIGDAGDRARLLANAHDALAPGGWLYLSASGVSDDLNPDYARLYEHDFPLTGERHTYLSRDTGGNALYRTHHFTRDELTALLRAAGFVAVEIAETLEASSRRPDQRARFFYGFCRRPCGDPPEASL